MEAICKGNLVQFHQEFLPASPKVAIRCSTSRPAFYIDTHTSFHHRLPPSSPDVQSSPRRCSSRQPRKSSRLNRLITEPLGLELNKKRASKSSSSAVSKCSECVVTIN